MPPASVAATMMVAPVMRTKVLLLITRSRTSPELPAFEGRRDFTTDRTHGTADESSQVSTACGSGRVLSPAARAVVAAARTRPLPQAVLTCPCDAHLLSC